MDKIIKFNAENISRNGAIDESEATLFLLIQNHIKKFGVKQMNLKFSTEKGFEPFIMYDIIRIK